MPQDDIQTQRPSPAEEDQAQAFAFQQQLQEQRAQDRAIQQQLASRALLEGSQDSTTVNPINDEGGDAEEDDEEEGSRSKVRSGQEPASLATYGILFFLAVIIDVVIPILGGGIFLWPVSMAFGIVFKVLAFFFIHNIGSKEKLKAKMLSFVISSAFDIALDILPGNIAQVAVSFFLDYKDKILKVAKQMKKRREEP